ncbi:MAG: inorganic phosphate transporter [Flavobacteriaceae bacterium]|nr:inorganic phosphate transporter [Flavobacteriaceae bacterium]
MFFFFLTSGLFLGWALGANDAANVFGSAVGSKMIRFRQAAIIASIFVILGAVLQGSGGAESLGKLGSIDAIGGAFTVSLAAGITVFWMTKYNLPVSSTQAIVGAIIGWNFFTSSSTDPQSLVKIVTTWVAGPILGGVFAILIYKLVKYILIKSKTHLLTQDAITKYALIAVGAFGSYSLGANNIGNVVGVFVPSAPKIELDFGIFVLDGTQILFFIGGLAIALGIITYSKRVIMTVGNSLMKLTSETAFVVVFSHSLVLFIFSSQSLSDFFVFIGLPPIPLVPVSSSQVIVGSILGISLLKGGRNVDYSVLGKIAAGWVATPVLAGLISFISLFFLSNVFNVKVTQIPTENIVKEQIQITQPEINLPISTLNQPIVNTTDLQAERIDLIQITLIVSLIALILVAIYLLWINRNLRIQLKNTDYNDQILKYNEQQAVLEYELKITNNQNARLEAAVKTKKKAQKKLALDIIQKTEVLAQLKTEIDEIKKKPENEIKYSDLNNIKTLIVEQLNIEKERKSLNNYIQELNINFYQNLSTKYPELSEKEKRLCALLRLNLSSKEIASILGISFKSVEINRYRIRKKMSLKKDEKLHHIINKL